MTSLSPGVNLTDRQFELMCFMWLNHAFIFFKEVGIGSSYNVK